MVGDETCVVTEHTEDWCFADDHVVALPFVSIQEIAGGKIRLWRDYSNMDTLLSAAPKWWLDHIVASWSEPRTFTLTEELGEYAIRRVESNGKPYLYLIYFQLGEDGVWRVGSM